MRYQRASWRLTRMITIVLGALLILSACVSPAQAPGEGTTNATTEAREAEPATATDPETPVAGGTYITSYAPTPAYILSYVPTGWGLQYIHWQFSANALAEWNEEMTEFMPGLAESWEFSSDSTQVIFHLREDVTWHDGQPVTADDVVFSVKAWLSITDGYVQSLPTIVEGGQEYFEGNSDQLPGVTAVDEHTVQFNLPAPVPQSLFMQTVNAQPIMPKHQWEGQIQQGMTLDEVTQLDAMQYPIGTGPFQVTDYNPEQYIEYTRNPNYFRGEPLLEKIIIRLLEDEVPVATGLETGEIHAAPLWTKQHWPRLFELGQLRSWVDPVTGGIFRLDLNMRPERADSPLHDVRFRKALLYAIPRDTIGASFRMDVSEPASNIINNPIFTADLELTDYSYDPDKARALLAEMNYDPETAPELILSTTAFDNGPELTAIQQAAGEVGINISIFVVERAARPQLWANADEWDLHYQYQATPFDPAATLASLKGCLEPLGECGWLGSLTWDPPVRFHEILELQGQETVEATRKALLQEALMILDEELPFIPLWTEPNVYFINNRVRGMGQGVYRYGTFAGLTDIKAETWWLAPAQ